METADHDGDTLDLAWKVLRLNGIGAADLVRLRSAHTNDVYRADRTHIVRISRTPGSERRLRAEADLLHRLQDDMPVQRVIDCGLMEGVAYQVLGYVEGQSLTECWHLLPPSGIRNIARDLAACLRPFHAATHDGFGYLGAPPVTGTSWQDHILERFGRLRNDILRGPADGGVPEGAVEGVAEGVAEALAEAGHYLRAHAGCLGGGGATRSIHSDLWFGNILVDDGRLRGLIDFELAERAPLDKELYKLEVFCRAPEVYGEQGRFEPFIGEFRKAYPEMFEHPRLSMRLNLYDLLVVWRSYRHDIDARTIDAAVPPLRTLAATDEILSGRIARLV